MFKPASHGYVQFSLPYLGAYIRCQLAAEARDGGNDGGWGPTPRRTYPPKSSSERHELRKYGTLAVGGLSRLIVLTQTGSFAFSVLYLPADSPLGKPWRVGYGGEAIV